MVKILTEDNYKDSVKGGVSLIDFYADWCMPCKMFAPILAKVSEELEQVKFFKVNVDENQELASEHAIMSIPTVLILKDGKVVERFSGLKQGGEIVGILSKHINILK